MFRGHEGAAILTLKAREFKWSYCRTTSPSLRQPEQSLMPYSRWIAGDRRTHPPSRMMAIALKRACIRSLHSATGLFDFLRSGERFILLCEGFL